MEDASFAAVIALLMLVAGLYCCVRAVWDWRSQQPGLALVSIVLGVLQVLVAASIFAQPVQPHAVMIDLPRP